MVQKTHKKMQNQPQAMISNEIQRINVYERSDYATELLNRVPRHLLSAKEKGAVRLFDRRYDHREHVFEELADSLENVCIKTIFPQRAHAIDQPLVVNDPIYLRPALEISGHYPPDTYTHFSRALIQTFAHNEPFYRGLASSLEDFYFGIAYVDTRLDKTYAITKDITNENVVEGLRLTYNAYDNFHQNLDRLIFLGSPRAINTAEAMQILSRSMVSLTNVINTLL